mgnify:CR=1 FL=1
MSLRNGEKMPMQWDDKFDRAERKWNTWHMAEYAQPDRILPKIIEDKASKFADRTLFQFRDRALTYEEFNQQINKAANGFLRLGVKPGDNVALMLPNIPEFLSIWFGLNKIGAVCVPVNVAMRGESLAYPIDHTDCIGMVFDASYAPHLENVIDRLPKLRFCVTVNDATANFRDNITSLNFNEFEAESSVAPSVATSFKDMSSIIFTSGTTGRSKGVMISHNYWYEIWSEAVRYARYTEDDTLYTGLPFFHSSAFGTTIGPALLADARAVLVERFSASRMLDDCRKWECTAAKYIGSIISILMKQPPTAEDTNNPIRLMVGSATPPHLYKAFEERFNTRLLEGYGMTECTIALVNPLDNIRPGSCGKPITGWRVKIFDENDNECPPGVVGEIVTQPTRSFLGTSGYYNAPEATLDLMRNFWMHTGDYGKTDEDGYFYFVDRKKQALRRRGENISSFEVEAAIDTHPAVLESGVVGVPAELGEDDVKAVIVLKDGATLTPEELVEWCKSRLAYFAIPRYIAFRQSLPKTASQRVEKYKLKAEGVTADCWDSEAAGIDLKS